jgi:hypothetical protein
MREAVNRGGPAGGRDSRPLAGPRADSWWSFERSSKVSAAEVPKFLIRFHRRCLAARFFPDRLLRRDLLRGLRPLPLLIPPIVKRLVRRLFFHISQLTPAQNTHGRQLASAVHSIAARRLWVAFSLGRGIKLVNPRVFFNFPLHSLPFICYKHFTESRRVAKPVVFVKLSVSSGI